MTKIPRHYYSCQTASRDPRPTTNPTMASHHPPHRRSQIRIKNPISILLLTALLFHHPNHLLPTVAANKQDLLQLITRLNSDVIELRNTIEASIATRCNSIKGCYESSYDECQSVYDSGTQMCPSGDQLGYAVQECGRGVGCNGLFDFGVTTVRLPQSIATGPNKNPTIPTVS